MKSDQIRINSRGDGIAEALLQTEKTAAYKNLNAKQTLRLRLLAEEMMGMLRSIVGEKEATYWVETEGNRFSLHLATKTKMNADLREELLKASTSGKNAAAKGFMGMVRDIIMQMSEQDDLSTMPLMMEYGYSAMDTGSFEAPMGVSMHGMLYSWSLQDYRAAIQDRKEEEAEKWDELEKSITAKLADEVKIFINGGAVEMVIEKTF